jgi:hypothetical protein
VNAELLGRAAAEYFNEGFLSAELKRKLEQTPDIELRLAARESLLPPRTAPDGCFIWLNHLVWLERVLEIAAVPLDADELEGLLVLKGERARFQAAHPACPHCGLPNERHALRCRECGGEIHG